MTEPKFKVGDLVRHRASGQQAVVIRAFLPTPDAPAYRYNVATGFSATIPNGYPEYELELVASDKAPECEKSCAAARMARQVEDFKAVFPEQFAANRNATFFDALRVRVMAGLAKSLPYGGEEHINRITDGVMKLLWPEVAREFDLIAEQRNGAIARVEELEAGKEPIPLHPIDRPTVPGTWLLARGRCFVLETVEAVEQWSASHRTSGVVETVFQWYGPRIVLSPLDRPSTTSATSATIATGPVAPSDPGANSP